MNYSQKKGGASTDWKLIAALGLTFCGLPAGALSQVNMEEFQLTREGIPPLSIYKFTPLDTGGVHPAIILWHGGGWRNGNPKQMFPIARQFAAQGYIAFVPEYRLLGKNAESISDCVDDAHAVVRWVEEHASILSVDPGKVHVGGGSAGGHLALCALVFWERGNHRPPIGFFGLNPVTTTSQERFRYAFGEDLARYDPTSALSSSTGRIMVLHGEEDGVVPLSYVQDMLRQARELGIRTDLKVYPGAQHGFFNEDRITLEQAQSLVEQIETFVNTETR